MRQIDGSAAESCLVPLTDVGVDDTWAMVEASPDGMILTDQDGVILVVNSRIEAMFGHDRGDLLGRTVEALLPERHRMIHTAHRVRYRAEPNVRAMGTGLDLMARRSDGSEFRVEVSLSPVTTVRGLRVVATVRDITDRVALEAHAHAVLHTIDSALDGVFMFTADTLEFQYVNDGAGNQLGYSRAELLAMTPLHITPDFTETTFRELLAPLLDETTPSHTYTTIHRRKDGHDVPVEIVIEYPPAAGPGQSRLLVALVRDITERLVTEHAIKEREAATRTLDERDRIARDLHDVVIQRLFAAGMGLQSIGSLIDNEHAARRVEDTVDELDATINELRAAIFRLTTRQSGTNPIGRVVQQSTEHLGFTPTLAVNGDPATVSAEIVGHLVAVLTEILSNVARHAHATSVDIDLNVDQNQITMVVADNGTGIAPTAPHGTGLANLAARAVQHDGNVTFAANADGTGTVVTWTAHDGRDSALLNTRTANRVRLQ